MRVLVPSGEVSRFLLTNGFQYSGSVGVKKSLVSNGTELG
jgi:hypothetical protein